jgi:hypothetical protein
MRNVVRAFAACVVFSSLVGCVASSDPAPADDREDQDEEAVPPPPKPAAAATVKPQSGYALAN